MNKNITAFIASIAMIASIAGTIPNVHAENNAVNGVDLSTAEDTKDFIPPVFDQHPLGSCVACATTYYQFTYEARKLKYDNYLKAHKDDPDQEKVKEEAKKIIDFAYSPADIYPLINAGKNKGSQEKLAYSVLKNRGALTLDQYKYDKYSGVFWDKTGSPVSIMDIPNTVYSTLDEEEKKLYEKVEGTYYYRRIGDYLTKDEYISLSEEEKKWYIPVDFTDLYYHFPKLYSSVKRNEQDLFNALRLRLDHYEGCSFEYKQILENSNNLKRVGYTADIDNEFISDIKGYLDEGKVVASSAPFNYKKGMADVVEVNGDTLVPTGEKAVAQNYYDIERGNDTESLSQGHEFTIVGYNDSITCDINGNNKIDEGETGAFKILNSHGQSFGNDGYVWVMYDAVRRHSTLEQAPTVPKGFERRPAIENAFKIYISEKDLKLVSEVDIMTNNYHDVAITNICDDNVLDVNGVPYSSSDIDPVVYSGPIFTDISDLCVNNNGNNSVYKICVNNRNSNYNTRIVVKSIKIKDDKGKEVASKQFVADEDVTAAYNRLAAGNYFENSISVNIDKGDLNYDGEYNDDDYKAVKAYFEAPEKSDLSLFQLELLDANDDKVIDKNDLDLLSSNVH